LKNKNNTCFGLGSFNFLFLDRIKIGTNVKNAIFSDQSDISSKLARKKRMVGCFLEIQASNASILSKAKIM
jgi:hypothetical protein